MIELASFSEHRVALAFSDYLRSVGITNHLEVEPDRFAVLLNADEDMERARRELEDFMRNPGDARYWQASWTSGRRIERPLDPNAPGMLEGWKRFIVQTGTVTLVVMAWCLLSFAAIQWWGNDYLLAMVFPEDWNHLGHEYWRLLTPVLLHANLMHLVFNLLWWYLLGNLVEKTQSGFQLAAVSLTCALVSNLAQYAYGGSNLFGGLSAVVYGLLGYIWMYPLCNPAVRFRLRGAILGFMIGWMMIGFSGLLDNVFGKMANAAHLSGFLTGVGLGVLFGLSDRFSGKRAEKGV